MTTRLIILLGLIAAFCGGLTYFWLHSIPTTASTRASVVAAPRALWDLPLNDLGGKSTKLALWEGKPLVINFWASWCAPCREEIPLLNSLARENPAIQFVGVAIDRPESIRQFLVKVPVDYPVLVGNYQTLESIVTLGNPEKGLPFTLILDKGGKVLATFKGKVDEGIRSKLPSL